VVQVRECPADKFTIGYWIGDCGVSAQPRNLKLAAYQAVSIHGNMAAADPHRLVLMLMDGVLDRLASARGCIEHGDIARNAKLLHSCVILLGELRDSLNLAQGGELARNLSELYDYMVRQLLRANVNSDVELVKEVSSLLTEVRGAWTAIAPEMRHAKLPGETAPQRY
jgi:flagellar protein FliS